MNFLHEADMYDFFLKSDFVVKNFRSFSSEKIFFGQEIGSLFGIPDIIFTQIDSEKILSIIAIELKLSNWKRAFEQAFRYRSFANYSFVVLDNSMINPAKKNIDQFQKKNIGLLGLDNSGNIYDYYLPKNKKPYSEQLEAKLTEMVIKDKVFQEFSPCY